MNRCLEDPNRLHESKEMRIIVILTVREEGDVIAETLRGFLEWADELFIYDTGSLDETYQIIQDYECRYKGRITCCREEVLFKDPIRGYVFALFRQRFRNGDWICMADADEIYHISPRIFLSTQCDSHEHAVFIQYYNFWFTTDHLRLWLSGEASLMDRSKPVFERLRHYMVGIHPGETRLFRYRSSMHWLPNEGCPRNSGFPAKEKIPVRHYPFRDPPQMIRRAALRKWMLENVWDAKTRMQSHWNWNWFQTIKNSNSDGVQFWQPGAEFPLVRRSDHLRPPTSTKGQILLFLQRYNLILLRDIFRRRAKLATLRPSRISNEARMQLEDEFRKAADWRAELPPHLISGVDSV
jgi:glycosyltransferase involved in cell wall biosynthesis